MTHFCKTAKETVIDICYFSLLILFVSNIKHKFLSRKISSLKNTKENIRHIDHLLSKEFLSNLKIERI